MIGELFAIIAPVFLIVAIGFAWARIGRPFDTEFVTAIVLMVATPCLVFSSLTGLGVDLTLSGEVALAQFLLLLTWGVVGSLGLRLAGNLPAHSYLPTLMFGNLGNMGLPLSFFAFGAPGLALATVAFAVHSIAQFTVGIAIASGTASLKQLLRTPVVWGVAAAIPFMATGATVPPWIHNTTSVLGNILVPMMLLTMGVALSRLQWPKLGRSSALAVVRLVGGLAFGLIVSEGLGLDGTARGVVIIMSAMPVAIFNFIFAQRYKRAPDEVAAAIVISTALSFLTLPGLLLIVL
ncbi:MAG TPA: AEC family transporter [Alphaproteobacteria bacterium]|nr:AEC family transporter [Alphaproteobacteria bacterium]